MLDLKNGAVLVTKSGRRFIVCRYKRRDDAPDTFRLRSTVHTAEGAGLVLTKEWTADEMVVWGLALEGEGGG